MADQLSLRGGTTTEHGTFTGANKEVTVDTTKKTLVVHDGATVGGHPIMRENGSNSALALASAATPSLKFTGDPNTGIYSPGADQVAISTNGTGRLFVDASGNVGVGVSSPDGQLTFNAAPSNTPHLRFQNQLVNADAAFSFYGDTFGTDIHIGSNEYVTSAGVNTRFDTGLASSSISVDRFGRIKFNTGTGAATERMRLDSSGRLGLGTSSPSAKAEIVSSGSESTLILRNSSATGSTYSELKFAPFTGTTAASASIRAEYYTNNFSSLAFRTTNIASEPVTRLFIDGGGNVGIGTTAPGSKLTVNDTTNAHVQLGFNDLFYGRVGRNSAGAYEFSSFENGAPLTFGTTGTTGSTTERLRIDSSGRLLVGTSSARDYRDFGTVRTEIAGTDFNSSSLALSNNQNTINGAFIIFHKSRGSAVGANTIVNAQDLLGSIWFTGSDGTSNEFRGAEITAFVDGTPGANDMPGRLVFSTTADGASSPTERMRITSDAYVRLAAGTGGIQFNGDTAAANALDDYEEGTWTATLHDAATGGNQSSTTGNGYYTKTGNLVSCFIEGFDNISTAGMTAGNMVHVSLPFAVGTLTNGIGSVQWNDTGAALAAGSTPYLTMGRSATRAQIRIQGNQFSDTTFNVSTLTTGSSDLRNFYIVYRA